MAVEEWHVTEAYANTKSILGEAPYYVAARHELRFVDISSHKLLTVDLAKGPESLRAISTSMPIGMTADLEDEDSSEVILAGVKDGVTRFNLDTGEHVHVAKYWTGHPAVEDRTKRFRSNDGGVDSHGRLWVEAFVDPEFSEVTEEGVLMRLDSDGSLQTILEGSQIPNGISWCASSSVFYYTDSQHQSIYIFDFDAETGSISNKRVFFHISEQDVFPDGHAMDIHRNLWVACWGGSRVLRISPNAEVTGVIHLPTRNITAAAFAGTELFVTSARESEPDKYPSSATYGGDLFKVDVGVAGVPMTKAKLRR